MPQPHDQRTRIALRIARMSWVFISLFVGSVMAASYLIGGDARLWGLPAWISVGNIIIPVVFVGLLIIVVEKFIPDIDLDDQKNPREDA